MKKFAFYCSGKASRVLKFYYRNSYLDYPAVFILYDGDDTEVEEDLKKNIPGINIINYKTFNHLDKKIVFSEYLLNLLIEFKIDYLFCFGNKILKGELLNLYHNKIINFHPSLLPSFPGLMSIDKALESNVQLLGNTAHFIDKGIDTGPIIMQSVISRQIYNTYEDVLFLQLIMLEKIWHLLNLEKIYVENDKVIIESEKVNSFYLSI